MHKVVSVVAPGISSTAVPGKHLTIIRDHTGGRFGDTAIGLVPPHLVHCQPVDGTTESSR